MPSTSMHAFAFAMALALVGCASVKQAHVIDDATLIQDVTIISPERAAPLRHADVVVRDGRIAEIGTNLVAGVNVQRVDGHGRYLIPGLIDSHVHVGHPSALDDDAIEAHPDLLVAYRAQVPRAFLAFGFTTVVDLDLKQQDRAWFEAAPLRPNFFHCGRGVRTAGGYGAQHLTAESAVRRSLNLVYEPDQAANWPAGLDPTEYTFANAVQRAEAAGATCLKVFYEPGFGGTFQWPVPSANTLKTLHTEAAAHHLPMFVHANSVEAWRAALDAHADVIAHGLWYWQGNQSDPEPTSEARSVIAAAASSGIGIQPTLQVIYGEEAILDPSIMEDPRFALAMPRSVVAYLHTEEAQKARSAVADSYLKGVPNFPALLKSVESRTTRSLQLMLKSNAHLLLGSDTPAGDGIEGTGNPPRLNGRLEIQRWADAGVPLARILRAATLDNALALGLEKDLGSIEVGKKADLILLSADPLASVKAYDSIETVFLKGVPIARSSLVPVD